MSSSERVDSYKRKIASRRSASRAQLTLSPGVPEVAEGVVRLAFLETPRKEPTSARSAGLVWRLQARAAR